MGTGITALDTLLGGKISRGTLVLLRGAPGSGKTTLALQIMAHNRKSPVAFFSLEKDPNDVIEHMINAFGLPLAPHDLGKLVVRLSQTQVETAFPAIEGRPWDAAAADEIGRSLVGLISEDKGGKDLAEAISSDHPTSTPLVVIDSVNVLAAIVMQHFGKTANLRLALEGICSGIQRHMKGAVVLLTGEYDIANSNALSVAAESFFCDVVIQLAEEEVIQGRWGPGDDSLEGKGARPGLSARAKIEKRLFCRVLKARNLPNQARRCAYDIVKGQGLVFYETYPGDGVIMLFHENRAQEDAWEDFFRRDLPQLYPSLYHDSFDRSGLQRTFAGLRRFRHVPKRTDMCVSSLDTYWVNWYVELSQRMDIAGRISRILEECLASDDRESSKFSRIVGIVHRRMTELHDASGDESPVSGKQVDEIAGLVRDKVCGECRNKESCEPKLRQAIQDACEYLETSEAQAGLTHLLPWDDLRLFGERRSEIIAELETRRPVEHRPVFRPGHRQKTDKILAVPCDANIGLFVYRRDLLREVARGLGADRLASAIIGAYDAQQKDLRAFEALWPKVELTIQKPLQINDAAQYLAEQLIKGSPPETWEEVIALTRETSNCFLIETRTFDTFLCTLLEFVWGCGGDITVHLDYEFYDVTEAKHLFEALNYLRIMFQEGIVPLDCSLEPEALREPFRGVRQQPNPAGGRPATRRPEKTDWLFARHWYSTFVDVLVARGEDREPVWQPKGIELGIAQIPVSLFQYVKNNRNPKHVSCWGEWYLAAVKGSENEALAVDLINNLMSSQKICDRAFACASLPTVEAFYRMYGDAKCFNLPERRDIVLPEMTFNDLRKMLFENARSRTQIFDYRHCMREFHAVLQDVHTIRDVQPDALARKIKEAIEKVESLGSRPMLLH